MWIRTLKDRYRGVSPKKRRAIKLALGVAIGGSLGYAYYAAIGCSTGGCPITSSPFISTAYGALIGAFATGGF